MEIGATKTKGADPGSAHAVCVIGFIPGPQLGIDVERRTGKIDIGIGFVKIETRGQQLVMQGKACLEQTRGAGAALQVADIGFYRTQCHRTPLEATVAENGAQGIHFHYIPDPG